MRPRIDQYFLEIARVVAKRSTCLRVPEGVGAVLVRDRKILSTGYAGSIRGAAHCTDVGCLQIGDDPGCKRTIHAEINSVLSAAQHGVSIDESTCYLFPFSPCFPCFQALVNGGVKRFVFPSEYRIIEPQITLARDLNIGWDLVQA